MMQNSTYFNSPLGKIVLAGDEAGLTGLWFEGQKYFGGDYAVLPPEGELPVFAEARRWLELYFSGKKPDFTPPLHPNGSAFRQEVWSLLPEIPYGSTTTYGTLAAELAHRRGISRMSAQAVGGAVGHNPISLIIPCHRVVGADGGLTGYAGGLWRKRALLEIEGSELSLEKRV